MGSYRYPTIQTVTATTRGKGSSDTATLKSMFPSSPGNSVDMADFRNKNYDALTDGEIVDNQQVGNFSLDYVNAPSYADVPTGAGGLPASAWVPNPMSPGEGSVNPADLAAAPAGYGTVPTNGAHAGSSNPVTAQERDPSVSSAKTSGIT